LAIGVLGAGRVGAVLGAALAAAGHRVTGVSAVSRASLDRVEALLPATPVLPADRVVVGADLVLLTVPDDALGALVEGLASTGSWRSGQLVAHTSGRHGLQVLRPAVDRGVLPLALHPVMTFTGTSMDLNRLAGCVFGVTAPAALLPIADALVLEMGGEPLHVRDEQRVLYHAALAHASNHLMTLVTSSADLLAAAGVEDPSRVLEPLVTAALDNALRVGDRALTGPVARGDATTVAAHLSAVTAAAPETAAAYRAMARLTAERALAAGLLDAPRAEGLLDVLSDEAGQR
jgi:predicted short-subunit dehydrogenase-like oxidoreductase (DUF2520 family)